LPPPARYDNAIVDRCSPIAQVEGIGRHAEWHNAYNSRADDGLNARRAAWARPAMRVGVSPRHDSVAPRTEFYRLARLTCC
jgi:hypothetical protein